MVDCLKERNKLFFHLFIPVQIQSSFHFLIASLDPLPSLSGSSNRVIQVQKQITQDPDLYPFNGVLSTSLHAPTSSQTRHTRKNRGRRLHKVSRKKEQGGLLGIGRVNWLVLFLWLCKVTNVRRESWVRRSAGQHFTCALYSKVAPGSRAVGGLGFPFTFSGRQTWHLGTELQFPPRSEAAGRRGTEGWKGKQGERKPYLLAEAREPEVSNRWSWKARAAGCRMENGGPLWVYTELSPWKTHRLSSRGLVWEPWGFPWWGRKHGRKISAQVIVIRHRKWNGFLYLKNQREKTKCLDCVSHLLGPLAMGDFRGIQERYRILLPPLKPQGFYIQIGYLCAFQFARRHRFVLFYNFRENQK